MRLFRTTMPIYLQLIILAAVLAVLGWAIYTLEDRALYHPHYSEFTDDPLRIFTSYEVGKELAPKLQDVTITTADGIKLHAWYIPAAPGKPTAVFAHGNGGNIGERPGVVWAFTKRGYGFLAFDYRGYGKSAGTCSEAGFYKDLEAASDYLANEKHIPTTDQIAIGESLGGAVVIDVAARRPFKALVLYSTFTSVPDTAKYLGTSGQLGVERYIPDWFIRQRYDSLAKIPRITAPLLLIYGDQDKMMPASMSEKLLAAASSTTKKRIVIQGAGHNEIIQTGHQQIMDAFEDLLAEAARRL